MSAITALLGVMSYYIPFLTLLIFIWPIPIIILGKRQGVSISIMATVTAGVLVSLFTPILFAVQIIIMYGILGIALGYAYKKDLNLLKTILIGYTTSFISIVVLLQFYNLLTGVNIITEITTMMEMSIGEITNIYKGMGVNPENLNLITERIDAMINMMKVLFPAMLLLIPVAITGINMVISERFLKRLGYEVVKIPPLRNWKLPNNASYGLFFIIIITALGQYLGIKNFNLVYENVIYLLLITFFVQGLAVLSYLFYYKKLSKGIRIVGYISVFLLPLFQTIVHLLGLFDVLFNFRKLIKYKQG